MARSNKFASIKCTLLSRFGTMKLIPILLQTEIPLAGPLFWEWQWRHMCCWRLSLGSDGRLLPRRDHKACTTPYHARQTTQGISKSKEEHSSTVLVEHLKSKKKTVLECSQKLIRGSLDFDPPWVACTITHSLPFFKIGLVLRKKHTLFRVFRT